MPETRVLRTAATSQDRRAWFDVPCRGFLPRKPRNVSAPGKSLAVPRASQNERRSSALWKPSLVARKEFVMGFLFGNRVAVTGGEHLFEELEERIVLDASVDPTIHDNPHSGSDPLHNWNLGYSSDPSISMDHILDTGDLAAYHGDLGTPYPSITLGVVPPTDGAALVDLSGAIRVSGAPTITVGGSDVVPLMHCVITYNPRPLTSNLIDSLNFSEVAASGGDVTIKEPSGTGVLARSWQIDAPYDSLNAILATMQASLNGGTGNAEIDVTLTDPNHSLDVDSAPLVTRTLYIPVTADPAYVAPFSATDGPVITAPSTITAAGGTGAAGIFGGVQIADMKAQVVDVGLAVYHATIGGTGAIPGVQVIQDVPGSSVSTPPGATAGNDWVPSWLYVRGNLADVNTYLSNLTYDHLGTYGNPGDSVADDVLEITVDDRGTNANPFWHGSPVSRAAGASIPIYY